MKLSRLAVLSGLFGLLLWTGAARAETTVELPEGGTIGELLSELMTRFPKLAPMQKSMLIAVGVDYAVHEQVLKPGDEVSLFPPVQGG